MIPAGFGARVQPNGVRPVIQHALQPDGARFLVPVLDAAALVGDLVGAHEGVADEDDFVLGLVGVDDVVGGRLHVMAAAVVLPQVFVNAVVEIVIFQVLELRPAGGEQFLADPDMVVH